MAEQKVNDIREIDINSIEPTGFIDKNRLKTALNQLSELKRLVDEMLYIRDKFQLPSHLVGKINSFNSALINFVNQIEENEAGSPDTIARKKDQYLTTINNYYNQCFNIEQQNNTNKLIEYYSIVKSFSFNDDKIKEEIESVKDNFADSIKESQEIIKTLKNDSAESETILNELKKKISNQTVSDYAIVFQKEAEKYKTQAYKWLKTGVIMIIVFIVLLMLTAYYNLLPTEIFDKEGIFVRYNFSNLVIKILIIAVLVFIISFSFKQYSISRHLQTLNTHRQNALNSYQLFTKSIVGDDTNSRNALMIQVAKAIYEHTQSTGFLNEKGQSVNSGIVELTKIIGKNNTL